MDNNLICEVDGCTESAHRYYFPDDETSEVLCPEHAVDAGFCIGCGNFWAGVEAFDFSRIKGICPNCISQYEESDDDEDYFGSVHYY